MKKTMTAMECNQMVNTIKSKYIAMPILLLAGLVKLAFVLV